MSRSKRWFVAVAAAFVLVSLMSAGDGDGDATAYYQGKASWSQTTSHDGSPWL